MTAPETVLASLDRRRREWMRAVGAGDLEAYTDLLAEDGVWLPPTADPLVGREAFRSWLLRYLERFEYDFSASPEQLRVLGDRAVELGVYRSALRARGGATPVVHTGRYLVLWRRDPDGVWRMDRYADITPEEAADS